MILKLPTLNSIEVDAGSNYYQQQKCKKIPWLLKSILVLIMLPFLGLFNMAQAQCPPGDVCSAVLSGPNPYTLLLNGSVATMGDVTLSGLVIPSTECGYTTTPYTFLVFDAAPSDGAIEDPLHRVFDCSDISASPITLWVVLKDDDSPSPNYYEDCDALVQLIVEVSDNDAPDLICPSNIGPVGTDFDAAGDGDCKTKINSTVVNTFTVSSSSGAAITNNGYDGTLASMAFAEATIANIPATATINDIEIDANISHDRLGDLTMKLVAPDGTVLGLVSQPGKAAGPDDGTGATGDNSNLEGNLGGITFSDVSVNLAETMGAGITNGQSVCIDDGLCDFKPDFDATPIPPVTSFALLSNAILNNTLMADDATDFNGAWRLYVGDGNGGASGTIDQFTIRIKFTGPLMHPTFSDNCPSGASSLMVQYDNTNDPINGVATDVTANAGTQNMHDFYTGITTVTYTATDNAGNANPCSFTVEITDNEDPEWDETQVVTAPSGSTIFSGTAGTNVNINTISGRGTMGVEIDCQHPDFNAALDYWQNLFLLPTASDNCGTSATVTEIGGFDNDYTCDPVNGRTEVKRRIIRRFEATDGTPANDLNVANGNHFRLRIYIVDKTGPDYSAETMTGNTVTETLPGSGIYNGGTLTLKISDYYDATDPLAPCHITTGIAASTEPAQKAVAIPSIEAIATECLQGTSAFTNGVDYTVGWTVTPVGTSPSPTALAGASSNNADQTYEVGSYDITYNAADDCSNSSTFTFQLVIEDDVAPLFPGCPLTANYTGINATSAVPGQCEATVQFPNNLATANDNCGGTITLTASGLHSPSGTTIPIDLNAGLGLAEGDFPIGITTVTYTFSDGVSPPATCTFDIEVTDDEAPTITNCADQTLPSVCEDALFPDYTSNGIAGDNCPGFTISQSPAKDEKLMNITLANDVPPLGLSDGDEISVTLTITDGVGTNTCTFTVTLQDNDEPIPTTLPMLANISTANDVAAGCGSKVVQAPTATDCNGTTIHGIPSSADGVAGPNQYIFNAGFTFVVWTYDDGNGNLKTQTQQITIDVDATPPTLKCPTTNVVVNTDPGQCSATNITGIAMTEKTPTVAPYNPNGADAPADFQAIDNCGIVTWQYSINGGVRISGQDAGGENFPVGSTTVTYYATDEEGNEGTCSFILKVEDNQAPATNCSFQILYTGDALPLFGGAADATPGNCSFEVGSADLSLDPTPTDNCSGPGSPTKLISSVTETGTPSSATYTSGGSNSSLAGATFTVDPTMGFAVFNIAWSISDGVFNQTCNQTIIIIDGEKPTFTCVNPQEQVAKGVMDDGSYDCTYTVQGNEFDISAVNDNCSVNFYTNNYNGTNTLNGAIFPVGTTTVKWSAFDNWGNVTTCDLDVIITDETGPQFNCLTPIIPLPPGGLLILDANDLVYNITDNCDVLGNTVTFKFTPPSFTCADATNAPINVLVEGTDADGNITICNTTVTVQETSSPTASCVNITKTLSNVANLGTVTVNAIELNGGSTDNCPGTLNYYINTVGNTSMTFDCSHKGANTVTLIVEDAGGNTSTCSSVITINDISPPTASCQPLTLPLDATGNLTVMASQFNLGSSDNCGPLTDANFTINSGLNGISVDCNHIGLGPIPITFEVSDGVNPAVTCSTTLTVLDNTSPVANCQDQTVHLDATGSLTINASMFNLASSDVCSGTTLTYTFVGGGTSLTLDCNDLGDNLMTINVQDQNGNIDQCTPTLTVLPANVVTFSAGTMTGASGAQVDIPVMADNFVDMRSFQFSVHIANGNVASIDAIISNISGTLIPSNTGTNDRSVTWSSPSEVTVANGTPIFYIRVTLSGASGDVSDVIIDGTPTVANVSQGCGLAPVITTINLVSPGSVTVDANTSSTISGTITREGAPVNNVVVNISGGTTGSTTTGSDGTYSFTVPLGSTVTITPSKDVNVLNGLFANDGAIIRAHIAAGVPVISTPYRLLAADVDLSSSSIVMDPTAADAGIIQNLIAGNFPDFHIWGNDSWRFVPHSHVFTVLSNPWFTPVPNSATITSTAGNQLVDFEGIKVGDVDAFANPQNLVTGDPIYVITEDQPLVTGQEYTINFSPRDFTDMVAYQFTLDFDKEKLSFVDTDFGALSNIVFGENQIEEGHLAIVWSEAMATELPEAATMFSITFTANEDLPSLEDIFSISGQVAEAVAFRSDQAPVDVLFELSTTTATTVPLSAQFALYQNHPNPFKAETSIGFNLPKGGEATLTVYDVSGKMIYTSVETYPRGYSEVSLQKGELPQTGLLYYQLESSDGIATRKMMMVE